MIKSLLEPDENQITENKIEATENATAETKIDKEFESAFADIEEKSETLPESATVKPESFESADDELIVSEKNNKPLETFESHNPHFFQSSDLSDEDEAEMKNLFADFSDDEINLDLPKNEKIEQTESTQTAPENVEEIPRETSNTEPVAETANETTNQTTSEILSETPPIEESKTEKPNYETPGLFYQPPAEKESFAETARKSGLAYAAAITLFGAVVFMLVIGWFADLLFGSKPWGMVGGILLGAAIGFFQFFRLTAQIFRNKD